MESRRACSRKPCKQQFWKTFRLAYFKFGAAFRPSSLSLEDTHQLRQFSLFGKLFVDDDICRSSFLHLFDVQLVVRDILGDIVMSFSKLTDYPTLVAHRSVKLQIWGKMLIVKTRICMTARNSIQHPSKRYTADTSFGGGGGWFITNSPGRSHDNRNKIVISSYLITFSHHKNHRNSLAFGPSRSLSVGTSCARKRTPSLRFLRLLSNHI